MKIANANIVTAFNDQTIGTKVVYLASFLSYLTAGILRTDFPKQRVPGQAVIALPEAANSTVSAGCGRRTLDPNDYIVRVHRGEVGLYLKRSHAAQVEGLSVVVYTRDAYCNDPDVAGDPAEMLRIEDATHIIVAVLAYAGPQSPLPRGTFLHNLAGGNKEAALYGADEIRKMAKDIEAYWGFWAIVAD